MATIVSPLEPVEPVTPAEANPGGLFSAVTFREDGGVRWDNGVRVSGVEGGKLSSFGAITCDPAINFVVDGSRTWGDFEAFSVYASFECKSLGVSKADAEDGATRRLLSFSEVTAEAYIWDTYLKDAPVLPEAGDTTDIAHAVGLLEHHALRNYGGGVIHVPRHLVHLLPRYDRTRNVLTLRSGVQVVAGAGYGESGESNRLVVTPLMFGYQSGVNTLGDDAQFNKSNNNMTALAERRYVIGWDAVGAPASIEVTL